MALNWQELAPAIDVFSKILNYSYFCVNKPDLLSPAFKKQKNLFNINPLSWNPAMQLCLPMNMAWPVKYVKALSLTDVQVGGGARREEERTDHRNKRLALLDFQGLFSRFIVQLKSVVKHPLTSAWAWSHQRDFVITKLCMAAHSCARHSECYET